MVTAFVCKLAAMLGWRLNFYCFISNYWLTDIFLSNQDILQIDDWKCCRKYSEYTRPLKSADSVSESLLPDTRREPSMTETSPEQKKCSRAINFTDMASGNLLKCNMP